MRQVRNRAFNVKAVRLNASARPNRQSLPVPRITYSNCEVHCRVSSVLPRNLGVYHT
jgi:hypothetical protein